MVRPTPFCKGTTDKFVLFAHNKPRFRVVYMVRPTPFCKSTTDKFVLFAHKKPRFRVVYMVRPTPFCKSTTDKFVLFAHKKPRFRVVYMVRPTGIELVSSAPQADTLSIELWALKRIFFTTCFLLHIYFNIFEKYLQNFSSYRRKHFSNGHRYNILKPILSVQSRVFQLPPKCAPGLIYIAVPGLTITPISLSHTSSAWPERS